MTKEYLLEDLQRLFEKTRTQALRFAQLQGWTVEKKKIGKVYKNVYKASEVDAYRASLVEVKEEKEKKADTDEESDEEEEQDPPADEDDSEDDEDKKSLASEGKKADENSDIEEPEKSAQPENGAETAPESKKALGTAEGLKDLQVKSVENFISSEMKSIEKKFLDQLAEKDEKI